MSNKIELSDEDSTSKVLLQLRLWCWSTLLALALLFAIVFSFLEYARGGHGLFGLVVFTRHFGNGDIT